MDVKPAGGSYARPPGRGVYASGKTGAEGAQQKPVSDSVDSVAGLVARVSAVADVRVGAVEGARRKISSGDIFSLDALEAAAARLLRDGI